MEQGQNTWPRNMFTLTERRWIPLLVAMLALQFAPLQGQWKPDDLEQVARTGLEEFEKGSYGEALKAYAHLLEAHPGNVLYKYYKGVCLVELNRDLDDAIELLYGASRNGVPNEALYYLAMAYHREYNFSEAMNYYQQYERLAGRQDAKDLKVKERLADCRAGRELTATYNPYEVMNVTFFDLRDSLQFSQIRMKGGQLERKAPAYFAAGEDRKGITSLMFMPAQVQRGEFVYYAGYGRNSKNGSQLFRVKKTTAKPWGEPEEIQALSGEGDEILPYFDPIGGDLYFASDGRAGIGGFDLYRSHYDAERDEWSEPINLGFPINSAADDYLLLPGSDLGMVMFFSNRQGTDSTLTVYRVHVAEPRREVEAGNHAMIRRISTLDDAALKLMEELETLAAGEQTSTPEETPQAGGASSRPDNGETVYTKVRVVQEARPAPSVLQEALRYQATSDSLKDLAVEARTKIRESEDPNDRWVWQKQIMLWEKRAAEEEAKADALYARMNRESGSAEPSPAVNVPESIALDRVVGETKVYRFVGELEGAPEEQATGPGRPDPSSQETAASLPEETPALPAETAAFRPAEPAATLPAKPAAMNRMEILPSSPYSEDNPIPMDVDLPAGVHYRIQLGAFGAPVLPGEFGGISPVTGEHLRDRNIYKYYAGKFSRYEDASLGLNRIRNQGYEDAFVVAWYMGNSITVQRAKQLEE
ncbi:MAG: tetratricopeptide repeat protein [Bacteroidales bacterium]